jgi:autotransporter-associated beta strand protein
VLDLRKVPESERRAAASSVTTAGRGWALGLRTATQERGWALPGVAVLGFGALLAGGMLLPVFAHAQTYIWGGTGSTTTTSGYGTASNWSNPPAGAPPGAPGQSAVFGSTGSSTVTVGGAPIFPDSWTFAANAQSYSISGNPVQFFLGGPTGGVINNANSGQAISISLNVDDAISPIMVQQLGNSTLVLAGTNGYSGGTLISAGTVRVTNANSLGSGTVTLNGGTLQMQSPTVVSVAFSNNVAINAPGGTVDANGAQVNLQGVIADSAGAGQLRLIDSTHSLTANVQLSGVNTYSGGTLVNGTTAVVSNNSSVGTGTVTVGNNGAFKGDGVSDLTFTNNFTLTGTTPGAAFDANGKTLTIAGNISGSGKLTIIDSTFGGVTVLTGNNSYAGGTVICNCATLQLGDSTHIASITGGVTNEGQFFVNNANFSAVTSITTQNGGNTVVLDANSASNANITNRTGGTLTFGRSGGTDTATAGNATILNNNGGTIFEANTNAGTANIANRNGGGTIFGDQASAASSTIVNNNNGFTNFTQFSTAGNATITTISGGTTSFFDNSTGGNAQFIANGTGYVDFSESVGPNGGRRIGAGSIAGSGLYYIGGGNTLAVGSNNLSTNVTGVIADNNPCGCTTGPGSLEKVGTGMLTLSGPNTYTGTTVVNGGFLDVEGSIAPSLLLTVNAGGALTGAGIDGNTTIAAGGIFLPGNGFGTSTQVQGNLAFQSGALYLVQLNSTSSTFANVTGTASAGGSVGVALDPNAIVMKKYMILQAAGVGGAFSGVSAPGGLVGTVTYDPTHAYLNFDLNYGAKNNLNINQQNVASTLQNFFNANGGISAVFASLSPQGLTQASGELGTGAQQATFNAMNLFMGLLTDPFANGRGNGTVAGGGAQGYAQEGGSLSSAAKRTGDVRDAFAKMPVKALPGASFDARWSVWGAAYGGGANISGNAALGSNSADVRAFGVVGGVDYRISPATVAGFALAGGGTNFSVSGFGSGRSDLFQAGAFVRHSIGAAYVTGALAYGAQEITTDRIVTIAGFDHLRAQFDANAWSGRVEGGYRYLTPWMGITPYAAGQFTTFSLPAYAEQVVAGAGNFALNYAARDVTDPRSELGVRTDKSYAMQNGILTLRGRLAWAHDFNPDRNVAAVFQTLPGASFVVNGAAQAHDSALTTASAEMKWMNGWSTAATFEGEFSSVSNSYAGKGAVRYSW